MLTRDLDQWSSEAIRGVEQQPLEARFEEVGRTELVGDGIALVSGLPRLQLGELVTFEDGSAGFALTLERDQIGWCCSIPAPASKRARQCVEAETLRVPVGEWLLGRIVDPLGRPLDEKGRLQAERTNRSSDLRQGSLNVSWSPSRSKPGP